MNVAARFVVTGRVQGVAFRAHTRDQARALGIVGHAINRRDGSVEVLAIGTAAAMDTLARWLGHGPPLARVAGVQRTDETVPASLPAGFDIA